MISRYLVLIQILNSCSVYYDKIHFYPGRTQSWFDSFHARLNKPNQTGKQTIVHLRCESTLTPYSGLNTILGNSYQTLKQHFIVFLNKHTVVEQKYHSRRLHISLLLLWNILLCILSPIPMTFLPNRQPFSECIFSPCAPNMHTIIEMPDMSHLLRSL